MLSGVFFICDVDYFFFRFFFRAPTRPLTALIADSIMPVDFLRRFAPLFFAFLFLAIESSRIINSPTLPLNG